MDVAYAVFATVTIAYNLFSAGADFARWERIAEGMDRVGVPRRILPWLGLPKAAAVIGLIVGFWIPAIGIAAAVGLVVFYALAIATHVRAKDYTFGLQYPFLALAAATLALGVVSA
ncbi:DoxX family protein [Streptomyces sp. TRM66268-LWL]|uniref:DoxX family protein n=1 Tax=Streptomyces polyasparticus TaxID=2767826 RepID=A0ABR7SE97_9ACTN|nr:DoxX family protein [Streptomyces polyasparticus]MBC9713825.1 DoxX family protein [Streptomyces polyasparticus]